MRPAARFVLPLCLVLPGLPPGFASGISVPNTLAGPGASIPIAVSFTSERSPISGLQFDLSFDDSALSLGILVGDATRASGKTVYFAPVSSRQIRFLIAELNANSISDGAVVRLFVNVQPGAAPGFYRIHFESATATDPSGQSVPISTSDGAVTVATTYGAPVVLEGVLNGANLLPGPVAPGEIITIVGSGVASPAAPQATTVRFDGLDAPLLYESSGQINAVVPFGIAGRTTTTLEIVHSSVTYTHLSVPVADAVPALFTMQGSGTGQGAILNQDASLNSPGNPAARGSVIVLYGTGAGQTNPPGIDGLIAGALLPKPVLPVSVEIGARSAEVLYAGAAPGLISGVVQVNCRVPSDIDPGNAVPVVLGAGSAVSPPVTVALK